MIIKINENYRITTDPSNFILQRNRVVKEGKNAGQESWDSIGFYGTLQEALKGCMKKDILISDLEDVSEINNHLSALYRQIECMKVEVEK